MKRFKQMFQSGKAKLVVLGAVASTTMANAALTAPTIDTGDFILVATAVITATGIFFGIRKALGLMK